MLNIDTRLLDGKTLTESEFWLLMQIAKRLGVKKTAFPSNHTLKQDCGWGAEKLQNNKQSLIKKGFLKVEKRKNKDNLFTSNIYKITSKFISVFIEIEDIEMEEEVENEVPHTDFPHTEEPIDGKAVHISINQVGSINQEKEKIQKGNFGSLKSEQPPQHLETKIENSLAFFETKFDTFRVAAKKAGLDGAGGNKTEFDRFKSKNKDWKQIIDLLLPALQKNVKDLADKKKRGEFAPNLPNFSTWMNQKRWERYEVTVEEDEPKSYIEACEKLERDFKAGKVREEDLPALVAENTRKFTTGH